MVDWNRVYEQKGIQYNSHPAREDLVEKQEAERKLAEKDKEIARLKEMLIEERAKYLAFYEYDDPSGPDEKHRKSAREQIEKELKGREAEKSPYQITYPSPDGPIKELTWAIIEKTVLNPPLIGGRVSEIRLSPKDYTRLVPYVQFPPGPNPMFRDIPIKEDDTLKPGTWEGDITIEYMSG